MNLCDLYECKTKFEIDPGDSSEDKLIGMLIEEAGHWIEEILGRKLTYKTRTESYKGTGTIKLLLRARPVDAFPVNTNYLPLAVSLDESANFGSSSDAFDPTTTPLVYGDDYCLQIDSDDGSATSRSGILIRIGDVWPKPSYRQRGYLSPFIDDDNGSIKVVYTAGFTPDSLPPMLRSACVFLVGRMRYILPQSMELGSDGYEERSLGFIQERRNYLTALIWPMICQYRNWKI